MFLFFFHVEMPKAYIPVYLVLLTFNLLLPSDTTGFLLNIFMSLLSVYRTVLDFCPFSVLSSGDCDHLCGTCVGSTSPSLRQYVCPSVSLSHSFIIQYHFGTITNSSWKLCVNRSLLMQYVQLALHRNLVAMATDRKQ